MQSEWLLNKLIRVPADRREALLRTSGPLESVVPSLADEVEKLAMTQVEHAVEAGSVLVDLCDAVCGPRERGRALRAHAQALAYSGRFREALPVFEKAMSICREGGHPIELAQAQLASIHALVHLARYDDAIEAGESARAVFLEADEPAFAGRADTSLGGVYQKLDEPATALEHFDRARQALQDDPIALAQLESNRGLALQSLDDLPGAEDAFRAALPAFEAAHMAWACAIVEGNLAALAARQGRLQDALFFFERERRHLEHDAAPAELARALVEQGEALTALRLLNEAEADYRAALPMLETHGQVREAVQARAGLGRVLAFLGKSNEAKEILECASHELTELGQPAECARLNLILSEIHLKSGEAPQARVLAEEALTTLHARPVDAAAARYHVARAALALGDMEVATGELDQAIQSATQLGLGPLLADLLYLRGLTHEAAGHRGAAIGDLTRSVSLIERVRGSLQAERFRAAFHTNRLAAYEELVSLALDHGTERSWQIAFDTIERAKSRALLDQLHGAVELAHAKPSEPRDWAEATLATTLTNLHAELNAAYSKFADEQAEGGGSVGAPRHHIQNLERRLEKLESRLATTSGVVGLHARPVHLEQLQSELDDDSALVEYFEVKGEVLGLVATRASKAVFRRLSTADTLNERIQRVRFQISRAMQPGAASTRRSAALLDDARRELSALHELVLAPMSETLKETSRLVIVPHGALHAVPFHALWDGKQHLVENATISCGPSASVLSRMQQRDARDSDDLNALVVGLADERAPLIEQEAMQVAAGLGQTDPILGKAATTALFMEQAPRAGLIHLACHGSFSPDHPLGSGIRLADRWLTLKEIYGLHLKAELVTLAACDTGRNVIGSGDELLGLIRAFVAAGAGAVIATLWIANDKISATLMNRLYNEVRSVQKGAAVAEALRTAQLEVMAERPHPAFWAPYIHIGGL